MLSTGNHPMPCCGAALDCAGLAASVGQDGTPGETWVLSVPELRCGACVAKIEWLLGARKDVLSVRANLTLKRVSVVLPGPESDPGAIIAALEAEGYSAFPAESGDLAEAANDRTSRQLLRAIAVAGFGAMNIMLLSVGVWSGAEGQTRDLFHLISALIAVPVAAYAGQPFFRSALAALGAGRMNMDLPIAIAVLLALALSLFETMRGGEHVFFDAAVTLLFFLLIGRYLDHLMRARARSAITGLERLSPRGAMLRQEDGGFAFAKLDAVDTGATLLIAAGERVPVDARILEGVTDLDRSLVSGEAMPVAAGPGDVLEAGTLNLTGTIVARALCPAAESFLARMIAMQSQAEGARGAYVRIADRVARLYAPVVHLLALFTFIGWMIVSGGDWQHSIFIAISVLIITCPCALALAVPVAHVVAAGRLMRMGILMKDGGGLERLAEIDRAVFDKTGTLTSGAPSARLTGGGMIDPGAAALARQSTHPAARAIAAEYTGAPDRLPRVEEAEEVPGLGIEAMIAGRRARLGRADWVAEIADLPSGAASPVFARAGGVVQSFELTETLRLGARDVVNAFELAQIPVSMLSGDGGARAALVAAQLGIEEVHADATPADKIAVLEGLAAQGHRALMVGDGLNDAAALAAAHVSMAPASASDAGRTAADYVFLRDGLDAVTAAHATACDTARIVRQNFALALAYNCIAIPLAVAGLVTPLLAALAMSGSSILVICNALRLNREGTGRERIVAAPLRKAVA
ncbi:heavy metal translocating P-type ATPase [Sulfitobacter aestuarii]|uniref:Heavy metal translocating P-type ATPase n=1 Tax=Sulfitobacter aestuarii TaxID=2161676 RepID=A0ABW5U451_9RHOB